MYYKYYKSQKQPNSCPVCGGVVFENSISSSSTGEGDSNNDMIILHSAKWQCIECGQPIYNKCYNIDDKDTFFAYISIRNGWLEKNHKVCISFNNRTLDFTCVSYKGGDYQELSIPKDIRIILMSNQLTLLSYPEIRCGYAYDVSFYRFTFILGKWENRLSVDSSHIESHPLISSIIRAVNNIVKLN